VQTTRNGDRNRVWRTRPTTGAHDGWSDAVLFAQHSLNDVPYAWNLAHSLGLDDDRVWNDLAKAYEKLDPIAVLPVHTRLVERELADADARHYRGAAWRLKKMRNLAAGSSESAEVDEFIGDLRERYRRRPRLQLEFDRAGLPLSGQKPRFGR
jgi:hypothetical protein